MKGINMSSIGFDLTRISQDYYKISGNHIEIVETDKGGKATLSVLFKNNQNKEYIVINTKIKHILKYLTNQKHADGVIIESNKTDRSKCSLYIVELKSSLDSSEWSKVKRQFEGATLTALALASTMGITRIESIKYVTGYTDSTNLEKNLEYYRKKARVTGPAALKQFSGKNQFEVEEWFADQVIMFNNVKYDHQKIQLTNDGDQNIGTVEIA